ncbi:MAG: phosphoribosylformylglycinamidine synthase subunit PurS [Deltaproteobacteria bacterium]|nr:phosphoribosylformylglycinamidine synthase subunit PurS [Deltaproteobacteria bacterium]
MKAQVHVKLKSGVLDPQGLAISKSLQSLGYDGIVSVRQGKVFDIEINGVDEKAAESMLKEVSSKLLANTVIEDFEVRVL